MSKEPILYDLVLLLSAEADEDTRTNLVAEVEAMIDGAGGNVSRKQSWGQRPTTYRIDHQSEADYTLLQFTGPTSLLESLSHTLRIADSVLRWSRSGLLYDHPRGETAIKPAAAWALLSRAWPAKTVCSRGA